MANRSPLSPQLLIYAYSNGYFPMPDPVTGQIGWFRPDPRAVIPLDHFHASRSLMRTIKRGIFSVTVDQAFADVMKACAARPGTWITPEFIAAYSELFRRGYAHSVEVWHDQHLAGGLYGVSLSGAFFAESMFHNETDASKVALLKLVEHMTGKGMSLLEVQFLTPHLSTLGAVEVTDEAYVKLLQEALASTARF
ncbi:leucyl/phenylalanyl-tRNA--protein transferase [bacterium]|nr:leucyl/phenylalanyl-tRNA--protein transferase [bacterium]